MASEDRDKIAIMQSSMLIHEAIFVVSGTYGHRI